MRNLTGKGTMKLRLEAHRRHRVMLLLGCSYIAMVLQKRQKHALRAAAYKYKCEKE